MNLFSRKSQVIIEYVTLAVLILSAMFLMKPYTIRSLNAYFKFSEESMKDSTSERFTQESLRPNATVGGCATGLWQIGGCGDAGCETVERFHWRDTDPAGCAENKRCVFDTTCCPVNRIGCGRSGTDSNGTTFNCLYTERLYERDCSPYSRTLWCQADPMCQPNCNPSVPDPNSTWCVGTVAGVAVTTDVTYIDSSDNCANYESGPGRKDCVAQCTAPAVVTYDYSQTPPVPNGCAVCGNGTQEPTEECDDSAPGQPGNCVGCHLYYFPCSAGAVPSFDGTIVFAWDGGAASRITCQNGFLLGVCDGAGVDGTGTPLSRGFHPGLHNCQGHVFDPAFPYCDFEGVINYNNPFECDGIGPMISCSGGKLLAVYKGGVPGDIILQPSGTACNVIGASGACDVGAGNDMSWTCSNVPTLTGLTGG